MKKNICLITNTYEIVFIDELSIFNNIITTFSLNHALVKILIYTEYNIIKYRDKTYTNTLLDRVNLLKEVKKNEDYISNIY